MIWFRKTQGLDSSTMRQIADDAGVSWSAESIGYRGRGIGYIDGDESDADQIQNAAQDLLGYRPIVIEEPPEAETKDG